MENREREVSCTVRIERCAVGTLSRFLFIWRQGRYILYSKKLSKRLIIQWVKRFRRGIIHLCLFWWILS